MKRVATAALCLLQACGGDAGSDSGRVGAHAEPVLSGKASSDSDDAVVAVLIQRSSGASVCSGTIIAPNLLLTARHCITETYEEDNIRCRADGSLDMPSGGVLGAPVEADQVTVYAGASPSKDDVSSLPGGEPSGIGTRIVTTTWPNVCRDDVALVVLDRDVPGPTLAFDLTTRVSKATRVSTVGYGLTELSNQNDLWSNRKRRDGVLVTYVDTLPNTFAISRAVCQGDSGGPAIDSVSGGIVGVYSLGFPGVDIASCTAANALNYYARLSAYEPLLREGFAAAEQPFPEPTSGAAGAPSSEAGAAPAAPVTSDAGAGGAAPDGEAPIEKSSLDDDSSCNLGRSSASASGVLWVSVLGALVGLARRRRRY